MVTRSDATGHRRAPRFKLVQTFPRPTPTSSPPSFGRMADARSPSSSLSGRSSYVASGSPSLSPPGRFTPSQQHAARRRRTIRMSGPGSSDTNEDGLSGLFGGSGSSNDGRNASSRQGSPPPTPFQRPTDVVEYIPVSILNSVLATLPEAQRKCGEDLLAKVEYIIPVEQWFDENAAVIKDNTIPMHLAGTMIGELKVSYAATDLPQERRYAIGPSIFKLKPSDPLRDAVTFGMYVDFDLRASEPTAFEHVCGLAQIDCTELTGMLSFTGSNTPFSSQHTLPSTLCH